MSHERIRNHKHTKDYDVYIGRPTKWGNPYSHLQHSKGTILVATRDEAVDLYRDYAEETFSTGELAELHGKTLGCWCAPQRCHGEILIELAEEAWNIINSPD